jgi:hypothetical protein
MTGKKTGCTTKAIRAVEVESGLMIWIKMLGLGISSMFSHPNG